MSEVIDARALFLAKQVQSQCNRLSWAHYTLEGEVVIETHDEEPEPPEAA